jgi:excisionase family DNA binding protein
MTEIGRDDLPEVLEPHHVQKYLGIGKGQAYELCNSNSFRTVKVGRLIKIPKKHFLDWFEGVADAKQD